MGTAPVLTSVWWYNRNACCYDYTKETTGADAYELERRLGHRSQRYIARYTNPPEEVAASYVEKL